MMRMDGGNTNVMKMDTFKKKQKAIGKARAESQRSHD